MMIPQVARRLINEFGKNAKILLDPYCGTGTSLVEANLFGINAIGIDINKLACLIAKVKTTRLDIETIVRNIPNKRMPLKNSPSNISGETSDTMRNEFIIILQKK